MDDLSLSNKTIRGLHTMLWQCLEQAVTERLIPYNPANGCRLPKKEKKKMQIIPPEKIRDYLKAAEEWGVLPMFYLELSTGLRRGELVALLWSDLNLQTKTLTVSKSVSRGKGELVVTEPKTENSVREIYLSDEAIRLLVEDRKNHPFSPYMFPSPKTGGMYGPDCVGRIHKKLLEKAGIEEHVRFHDLRHTFSTLAIQSGIDPKPSRRSSAVPRQNFRWTFTLQFKQALADYTRCEQADGVSVESRYRVGMAQYMLQNYDAATATFAGSLAIAPQDDDMYIADVYWLVLSQLRAGQADEAQKTFQQHYRPDMYVGHHTAYEKAMRVAAAGFAPMEDMLAELDAEEDDLQFAMTAYGLCVLLEAHSETEKADALRQKLLVRDGFWFCFSYLNN